MNFKHKNILLINKKNRRIKIFYSINKKNRRIKIFYL